MGHAERFLLARGDGDAGALANVAFRFDEPAELTNPWRETRQPIALAAGDISAFFAVVDPALLAEGATDDLRGLPGGVPTSGSLNRIHASRFEVQQGRGDPSSLGASITCGYDGSACDYSGQLQPYTVYVPSGAPPAAGYGFVLDLHNCNQTHNVRVGTDHVVQFSQPNSALVVTPLARGACYWYAGLAEADVWEVWADVARHYPVDWSTAVVTGTSMGGYGTYKLVGQYSDLFGAAAPIVPCVAAAVPWLGPPTAPPNGEDAVIYPLLPSLRNVPVMAWHGAADELCPYRSQRMVADEMFSLGYRMSFWTFSADHISLGATRVPLAGFVSGHRVDRDPASVTYATRAAASDAQYGLNADHAYWVSDVRLTSPGPGTVELFSHGFGQGRAAVAGPIADAGTLEPGSSDMAQVLPVYAYASETTSWRLGAPQPQVDRVEIRASNVSSVTIDVVRAGLSCRPVIDIVSEQPVEVHLAGCETAAGAAMSPAQGTGAALAGSSNRLPATGAATSLWAVALFIAAAVARTVSRRRASHS